MSTIRKAEETGTDKPVKKARLHVEPEKKGDEKVEEKKEEKEKKDTKVKDESIHKVECKLIQKDSFEAENHFYPRVLNSQLHPMVQAFMKLGNERIAARYCHLNPKVSEENLLKMLNTVPKIFRWAGCDLFNVTDANGKRQMIIIETNSCPSGQKSCPQATDDDKETGYHKLIRNTFAPFVKEQKDLPKGGLAVIYDKNPMENSGYAAAMADIFGEPCYLIEYFEDDKNPPVKWVDGVMHVRDAQQAWHPIRAAFRYVTQRPWSRIPLISKTLILNSVVSCLAGGRNKMVAAKAYDMLNHQIADTNLLIRVPQTISDVAKELVPVWVSAMGGHAVVKVPYANAGQGVYTICNDEELKIFMTSPQRYDKYIVQSLVGNASWTTHPRPGQFFHTCTIPNRKKESFVSDLRMMVMATPEGFVPIAIYSRRAEKPLSPKLKSNDDSWAMLGTNLSVKRNDGSWATETERLVLMDMKDFNRLGIGTDDLIDAYVQSVLAVIAIDNVAQKLVESGKFDFDLYKSLNADDAFLKEVVQGNARAIASGASSSSSSTSSSSSSSVSSSASALSSSTSVPMSS